MQQQKTSQIEIDAKYQSRIETEDKVVKINAEGLYYKELNSLLREVIKGNVERIELHNVCGQRYLGTDLDTTIQIDVYGTPGNDLGAFMSGPKMVIHGNAQDASGNTMNDGQIIVNGSRRRLNRSLNAGRQNLRQRLRGLPSRYPHERIPTQSPPNHHRRNSR